MTGVKRKAGGFSGTTSTSSATGAARRKNYPDGRISETGKYVIKKPGAKSLYQDDRITTAPLGMEPGSKRLKVDGTTYQQFTPAERSGRGAEKSALLYDDCSHHAEETMHGKRLEPGGGYSRSSATKETWGVSSALNIQIAQMTKGRAPVDHDAAPEVGQAYVTQGMSRNTVIGNPYHVAPVVARDGRTTVTLEATAPTAADERNGARQQGAYVSTGQLHFQTIGSKKDSFHAGLVADYSTDTKKPKPPITHVIEKIEEK